MFQYFFSYQTELPDDVGFPLFGQKHLLWLFGIVCSIVLTALFFRRMRERGRKRVLNVVLGGALALTGIHIVILAAVGQMNIQMLPLHLCGMAVFFYLIERITGSVFLKEIAACLFLPGAAAALLFPEWTPYPMLNFMTLQGFCYHALVVLYPVLLLAGGYVRPRMSHIWKPLLFLACVTVPVYLFDRATGSNYFFLTYAPAGSPLEMLENRLGYPGYLLPYAGIVFAVIFLLYCGFEIFRRLRGADRRRNPSE